MASGTILSHRAISADPVIPSHILRELFRAGSHASEGLRHEQKDSCLIHERGRLHRNVRETFSQCAVCKHSALIQNRNAMG
jgi:hypothetical protein